MVRGVAEGEPDAPSAIGGEAASARCRNCGAIAGGAHCPSCGQETSLALPTARQFLRDAAGRYVALDGRLWRTLGLLLARPGFLTLEYFAGRRRRYIRPARLFLVTSVLLFAVLRLVVDVPALVGDGAARRGDAAPSVEGAGAIANVAPRDPGGQAEARGERLEMPGFTLQFDDSGGLRAEGLGRVGAEINRRLDRFNAMSREDRSEQLVLGTLRYGPYAMFVLLPAFALLLLLVYLGRRGRHPKRPRRYAEHLVFAAHYHAFLALVLAAAALVARPAVTWIALLWSIAYGLWAMKSVYDGRWVGVLARAWLISVAYLVMFALVTVGLVIAAIVVR